VPNVFIGGNHIGGCDGNKIIPFTDVMFVSLLRVLDPHIFLCILFAATTAIHQEGKLVPLLTEAGAVAKASA
jgi:glutaredoxin 3